MANVFFPYVIVGHRFDEMISGSFIFIREFAFLGDFADSCVIVSHAFIYCLSKVSELKSSVVLIFPREEIIV